jgi:hypothetical protein
MKLNLVFKIILFAVVNIYNLILLAQDRNQQNQDDKVFIIPADVPFGTMKPALSRQKKLNPLIFQDEENNSDDSEMTLVRKPYQVVSRALMYMNPEERVVAMMHLKHASKGTKGIYSELLSSTEEFFRQKIVDIFKHYSETKELCQDIEDFKNRTCSRKLLGENPFGFSGDSRTLSSSCCYRMSRLGLVCGCTALCVHLPLSLVYLDVSNYVMIAVPTWFAGMGFNSGIAQCLEGWSVNNYITARNERSGLENKIENSNLRNYSNDAFASLILSDYQRNYPHNCNLDFEQREYLKNIIKIKKFLPEMK